MTNFNSTAGNDTFSGASRSDTAFTSGAMHEKSAVESAVSDTSS